MTKAELIETVSRKTGVNTRDCRIALEGAFEAIKNAGRTGEGVYIRGFGSFGLKNRAEKIARNILKNTPIVVPARNVPYFKPSPEYKVKQPK